MNNEHLQSDKLLLYAFYWSLARMVVTGFFLLFGSLSVVSSIFFGMSGLYNLYQIFWLISGATALYFVYVWYNSDRTIFGGTDIKDTIAFWAMVLTGINQGLISVLNGGFSPSFLYSMGTIGYWILGLLYFALAYYMWKRWGETNGALLKSEAPTMTASTSDEATPTEPEATDTPQ